MFDHKQDLFVCRSDQMQRGGRGVAHHCLQIPNVIPGYLGGRADWDGGQHDLDVSLDELFHCQIIVLCPMSCLRQPNLLMRPLSRERGIV